MTDTNLNDTSTLDSDISEPVVDEKTLWPSPGQFLKEIREELGLSHAQVSEALYITVHYVKALEIDDYAKLPGQTFIKGYYKSYANFLRADTEKVMDYYFNFIENLSNQNMQEAQAGESKNRNKTIPWIVMVIIVIAACAGAILGANSANSLPIPATLESMND